MMTIKEKIRTYLEYKGYNYNVVQELGINPSNFKPHRLSQSLNNDDLIKITSRFKDLSLDWLLYNQGDMIKENMLTRLLLFIKDNNIALKDFSKKTGIPEEFLTEENTFLTIQQTNRIKEAYPEIDDNWLQLGHGFMYENQSLSNVAEDTASYYKIDDSNKTGVINFRKIPLFLSLNDLFENKRIIKNYINLPLHRGDYAVINESLYYGDLIKKGDIICLKDVKAKIYNPDDLYLLKTEDDVRICRIINDKRIVNEILVCLNAESIKSDILKSSISNIFQVTFIGREL